MAEGFLIIVLVVVAYLLPTIVASARHHRNAGAIFVLNLLLGWTFLFWAVALVWSFTDNVRPSYADRYDSVGAERPVVLKVLGALILGIVLLVPALAILNSAGGRF